MGYHFDSKYDDLLLYDIANNYWELTFRTRLVSDMSPQIENSFIMATRGESYHAPKIFRKPLTKFTSCTFPNFL